MAKIVYACVRDIADAVQIKRRIESFIHKLVPDNIPDARCKVVGNGHIIYGISTHSPKIPEAGDSVCMGIVYDSPGKWWKPRTGHPEGTYAIFRADEDYVEAITDFACTRAIWYYKDDNIFVSGTSQRAVINIVGRFELERRNIPWMLSSGALAPSLSWCKNIHFLDPNGELLLDRNTWELTKRSVKAEFPLAKSPDAECELNLKKSLLNSFSSLDIDLSKWILPLSGGYDSRAIACLLKETGKDISRLESITWGTRGSEKNKTADGYVGAVTAKSLGLPHKFLATDDVNEPVEKIFNRFILCGEGRTDNIGGYSDGMNIWKNIFESGKYGIIRGDETFGMFPSKNFSRGRLLAGCHLCSDFSNLENYEQYGFEKQVLPDYLKEDPANDTPGLYRDKLYQEFRMPVTMSALSDIKYAYTEVLNPFLTGKIVKQSRTLPDHLRNDKVLFKKIIDEISPKIPYAIEQSTNVDILKTAPAIKILSNEMSLDYMKELFPEEFLNKIITKLQRPPAPLKKDLAEKLKAVLSRNLPVAVKDLFKKGMPKPAVDTGVLAFRIYITGKMYKMFLDDIKQGHEMNNQRLLKMK